MAYSLLSLGMDDREDHPEYAASFIPSSTTFEHNSRLPSIHLYTRFTYNSITIYPDRYDSPYGLQLHYGRDGHRKPEHVALHPLGVQDRGTLLEMLDLDPSAEPPSQRLQRM
ncbi:hypothetical protein [Candidatus Methylocalor cossyra]|uniref:hypothetical protein n=1 Tax=Candidatus Methylocalor cossyra TaxID=3108543 RepID=UPI0032B29017